MPITFQRKVTAGKVLAILIVATLGSLSYRNILVNERERTWVIHTHTVLENLDDLLDVAVRVEADQRGYIWSGDESYAAAFASEEKHLERRLDKVRSGLEVLEAVKKDSRFNQIPVVMLTSSREGPDVEDCYRLGANAYVVKTGGLPAVRRCGKNDRQILGRAQ